MSKTHTGAMPRGSHMLRIPPNPSESRTPKHLNPAPLTLRSGPFVSTFDYKVGRPNSSGLPKLPWGEPLSVSVCFHARPHEISPVGDSYQVHPGFAGTSLSQHSGLSGGVPHCIEAALLGAWRAVSVRSEKVATLLPRVLRIGAVGAGGTWSHDPAAAREAWQGACYRM